MPKYKIRQGCTRKIKIGDVWLSTKNAKEISKEEAEQLGDDVVVAKQDDGVEEGLILTPSQKATLKQRAKHDAEVKKAQEADEAKRKKQAENAKKASKKAEKEEKVTLKSKE